MQRGKKLSWTVPIAVLFLFQFAASIEASGHSPDASASLQNAIRQFNSGNYSGAVSTLQVAVIANPNNAELSYWLGRSYYEARGFEVVGSGPCGLPSDQRAITPAVGRTNYALPVSACVLTGASSANSAVWIRASGRAILKTMIIAYALRARATTSPSARMPSSITSAA